VSPVTAAKILAILQPLRTDVVESSMVGSR
jgi:hypothetical protein